MPQSRYRIESLLVEGFKAFAPSQEVAVGGKHCFLFGANARGKSSILEAIRWALFGLERDSDVRNRFREAVDCRVELRLRDAAGLWRLERRLRPGQLRSDLMITNPDGEEVTQREALPNLVRLGTSAGAVVFFSAQQATRARAYADLTRFHDILYAQLNLSEAERLRTELGRQLEEQFEIQRRRANDLQSAEDALRDQLNEVGARLEEILNNPPWDLDESPTRIASEERIRLFIDDLAGESGESVDSAWECPTALIQAEKWVHNASRSGEGKREEAITSARDAIRQLTADVDAIGEATERENAELEKATDLTGQLHEVSDGASIVELQKRLEDLSARLDRQAHAMRVRHAVVPLLGPDVESCPICDASVNGVELLTRVKDGLNKGGAAQEDVVQQVHLLEKRFEQAERLATQRDAAKQNAVRAREEREELAAKMMEELGGSVDTWEDLAEARLKELKDRLEELQHEDAYSADRSSSQLHRIRLLREEWRYHQLRDEEQRVRDELQDGLAPARNHLRSLEEFRSVVAAIHEVLSEEFDAAVDRALPLVSTQLTDAFRRLTDHPAFDLLRVERAHGPDQMVLRVGSTRASVPWSRPEDVLNGGAYAALGLIPHFVFSGLHGEHADLNVLIVDDPSQSFDTTHVELLLEELQRVSGHAQLFLATHEEERFRPIVERLFRPESFTVLRVTDFHPDQGPTLEFD